MSDFGEFEQYVTKTSSDNSSNSFGEFNQYTDQTPRARAIENSPMLKSEIREYKPSIGKTVSSMIGRIGGEVSPEIREQMKPAYETGKALQQLAGGRINALTFGTAEPLVRKFIPKEERNLAFLAGELSGMKPSIGVGQKIGSLIPQGVKGSTMLKKAIEGAITGALFPGTAKDRTTTAITGALLGPAIHGVSTGASKVGRGIKKSISKTKLEVQGKNAIKQVKSQVSRVSESSKMAKQAIKESTDKIASKIKTSYESNKTTLDKIASQEAKRATKIFQKRLPGFFRKNSKAYGEQLENISNKTKAKFTKTKVVDMIDDSLSEIKESFAENDKVTKVLNQLKTKYNKGGVTKAKDVSLQMLHKDIKNINKLLSSSAKKGMYTSDDVSLAIFKKNWGKLLEDVAPEMKRLNKAYQPVMKAMKSSYKMFKPTEGDFTKVQATNMLNKLGTGKELTSQEHNLISFLEKGSKVGGEVQGIGPITSKLKALGVRATKETEQVASSMINVNKKQLQDTALVIDKYSKALKFLGSREDNIKKLLGRKEVSSKVMSALRKGATGLVVLYTLFKMIKGATGNSGATYVHQTTPR